MKDRSGILNRMSKAMTNSRMFECKLGRLDSQARERRRFLQRSSDETKHVVEEAAKRLDDLKKAFLDNLCVKPPEEKDQKKSLGPEAPRPAQLCTVRTVDEVCDVICQQTGKELTAEQRLAFLDHRRCSGQAALESYREQPAASANVRGWPGGTGKTFLIKRLQDMCSFFGHPEWLLTTATTGNASFIIGGVQSTRRWA